ncbi:hypothetical protein B296_00042393 [Ensete ventricosum]|uniref:Uncharacterized protein n=1 Tax=Ensete ventricosum TaxID=4639 RepID=A0A426XLN9_ENSVE|nr:hypothetical protein B296_00042393 [Ensete ventricosum]
MLQGCRGCDFQVTDIYWKMAAKGSESGGSSDGGGRNGQQRCRLRLRCDFVAACGVGCSKGTTAIGEDGAAECTTVAEEVSDDMERETAAGHVHFGAGHDQGSWQRKIAAVVMKIDGSEGLLLIAFVPQGIVDGSIKEDGNERSLLAAMCNERCMLQLMG